MEESVPNELAEFYKALENIETLDTWDLHLNLKPTELPNDKWRGQLLIERKALFMNLNDGQLHQNIQVTGINGQLTQSIFSKIDVEYLIERLSATSNPWLKSRYAHILWQETKHNMYAEQAIDGYILTIENLNPSEIHELPNILTAIIYISAKSKKCKNKAEGLVTKLINENPIWIKVSILRSVMKFQFLAKTKLVEIAHSIPKWIENDTDKSYHATKFFLEQGLILYHKLGIVEDILYELLSTNEDIILDQHKDESDFLRYITVGQKAYYLKLANKTQESEKLFAEYNSLKQKVKLHQVSFELDEDETKMFNDYLNMKSRLILDLPTDSILAFFALDDGILVDPVENEQIAQKTIKDSVINLFNQSVFDINSNFKNLSDTEKLGAQKIQNYAISHGIRCNSLFMKVFIDGIIIGKLDYYRVYRFLETQTWYNQKFKRTLTDNEVDNNSTWLTLLAPSVHNLMAQFELSVLMNTNKINNFILAIDSMTVKFEGALRDFIRLCGGSTTTLKKGELTEQVLEELLDNQITKKFFSIKDIELFKYTFTQKGKNLRNNVAHSFMQFSDYTWEAITLVFLCILRLGKYTLAENSVNTK